MPPLRRSSTGRNFGALYLTGGPLLGADPPGFKDQNRKGGEPSQENDGTANPITANHGQNVDLNWFIEGVTFNNSAQNVVLVVVG